MVETAIYGYTAYLAGLGLLGLAALTVLVPIALAARVSDRAHSFLCHCDRRIG